MELFAQMTNVPLRYRLPNPPATFVGRQQEVAELTTSLKEAHVTMVVGPRGVGKTALALQTLHKRFPKRVAQCLYVSAAEVQDDVALRRRVLEALCAPHPDGASALPDDADALTEAIVDRAEEGPHWVLIDDLENAHTGIADSLLRVLSLYARGSRFLVLARTRPEVELASGNLLELGGLEEDAALQLARQLGKGRSPAALTAAVRAAGGSPWLLKEALNTALEDASSPPTSQEALLDGLGEGARRAAYVLSRLDIALPASTLSEASGVPEEEWRQELASRGWLQEHPAGVRLHEVARHALRAGTDHVGQDAWRKAGVAFSRDAAAAVQLEGIRLLVDAEAFDEAEGALDAILPQLLAEGHAPALWQMLQSVPSERFSGVRLRCAAELGNPTVLKQLTQPLGGSAADRLTWAETLYMRGDLSGALEAVLALTREPVAAEALPFRFDCLLLRARILIAQARGEEARRFLLRLTPATPEEGVRRDALLQSCAPVDALDDPDHHAALQALHTLAQQSTHLPSRVREPVRFQVAVAYLRRDALQLAANVLESPAANDSGEPLALFERRRATWLQAAVDLASGRLASAEERLDQLDPFLSSPSLLRAEVQCTRARLWLARGRFGQVLSLLREARAEAEQLGVLATAHRCERLTDRVEELLLLGEGRNRRKTRSDVLLRQPEVGTRELERAVTRATSTGHGVRAAELRAELCAGLLLMDRPAELEREVAELRRSAVEMGSERWQNEADLLAMAAELDWARLEALAAAEEVSPIAARRARALLGSGPYDLFDPLDRAVVERLRGASFVRLAVPAESSQATAGAWTPGWGLDVRRKRAWLPTGEWVDLSRRGLLARLLATLARHAGSASKEQLVEEVWEEAEYHPLRHDTRLQVAVHKFRELIEQDAGAPRLLLTTPSGYALAGPFRVVPEAGERLQDGVSGLAPAARSRA